MRGKLNIKEVALQYMKRLVEVYQLQFNRDNFVVDIIDGLESKILKFIIIKQEVDDSKFLAYSIASSLIDVSKLGSRRR